MRFETMGKAPKAAVRVADHLLSQVALCKKTLLIQAITCGLITLARQQILGWFFDETTIIQNDNRIVNLIPDINKPENIWLAFTAPSLFGTFMELEFRTLKQINFGISIQSEIRGSRVQVTRFGFNKP